MMRTVLYKMRLKQDEDRIQILHWGHFLSIILSLCIQFANNPSITGFTIKTVLIGVLYFYYFKTVKKLLYTFWSFSLLITCYIFYSMGDVLWGSSPWGLFYFYSFALICLSVEAYILSSPIYYPRVRWWEYDFRYRGDVRVKIKLGDDSFEGRLTDIRREAGCVSLFKDIEIGNTIKVIIEEDNEANFEIDADIVSKRRYSLGRPFRYGVKFLFNASFSKDDYDRFLEKWRLERKKLSELKYKKVHG